MLESLDINRLWRATIVGLAGAVVGIALAVAGLAWWGFVIALALSSMCIGFVVDLHPTEKRRAPEPQEAEPSARASEGPPPTDEQKRMREQKRLRDAKAREAAESQSGVGPAPSTADEHAEADVGPAPSTADEHAEADVGPATAEHAEADVGPAPSTADEHAEAEVGPAPSTADEPHAEAPPSPPRRTTGGIYVRLRTFDDAAEPVVEVTGYLGGSVRDGRGGPDWQMIYGAASWRGHAPSWLLFRLQDVVPDPSGGIFDARRGARVTITLKRDAQVGQGQRELPLIWDATRAERVVDVLQWWD